MKRYIANMLIRLARWIDPPNKEFLRFMVDRYTDYIISGQSTIKISRVDEKDMFLSTTDSHTFGDGKGPALKNTWTGATDVYKYPMKE